MAEYKWPESGTTALIGKRISRVDGPAKVTGAARYTYDIKRPGMLYAKVLRSPYAHSRIVSIDTSEAEKLPGVEAVYVVQEPKTEIHWEGDDIVAVAAVTEQIAEDAIRRIKVEYERLPHLVQEEDLGKTGDRAKPNSEQVTGEPDTAFQEPETVVLEGYYGLPVVTHCCLETHGNIAEWDGDMLTVYPSTQLVERLGGQLAEALGIKATNVRTLMQYVGAGFGSKFGVDRWGIAVCKLAQKAGKPVRLMLERDSELKVAGNRPSAYAKIKLAAKPDGTLTAWQSESWSTGGIGGGGSPPIPYIWNIPNQRKRHTGVSINAGSARAWRAPNHPQACYLTMCPIEDLAAKLKMDPLDLVIKNIALTGERSGLYRQELLKAAELMGWKKRWHPRGAGAAGPIKEGLGLSIHTWNGRGHASDCRVTINPDGSVEVALCTQDIGTGTRTVVNIVVAETLGLPMEAIKVSIGDNRLPPSGASGGSTTVGGVSSSTRRGALNALDALFAKVAPALGVSQDQLEAVGGRVQVKGDPAKSLSWKQATGQLGVAPVNAMGHNPGDGDLTSGGVGGVQMADVSVDTETGVIKVNKMVAVQDCGLIIDMKTAESQVYGAMIMGICYSLFEERVMDEATGRMLNPNMEFYKLAGFADIGEMVVHMWTDPEQQKRGVIGLGEPPTVSPGACLANAVTNAIGVRIPTLPLTPDKVLGALKKGGYCLMQAFEYATPTTKEQATALLGSQWEDAAVFAGGTDLISSMKEDLTAPRRLVDIKAIKELAGIQYGPSSGLRLGALVTIKELLGDPHVRKECPGLIDAAFGITSPQVRNRGTIGGDLCQRPRCWYFRGGLGLLAKDENGKSLVPGGDNRYHAIFGNSGPAYFVNPSSLAPLLTALGAKVRLHSSAGRREVPIEQFFVIPKADGERENVLKPNEILTEIVVPAGSWQTATYEVRQKEALDWPLAAASVALRMNGDRITSARVVLGHVAPIPWRAPEAEKYLEGKTITEDVALEAGDAAVREAHPLSKNAYKVQLARVAVKRALLKAAATRS